MQHLHLQWKIVQQQQQVWVILCMMGDQNILLTELRQFYLHLIQKPLLPTDTRKERLLGFATSQVLFFRPKRSLFYFVKMQKGAEHVCTVLYIQCAVQSYLCARFN